MKSGRTSYGLLKVPDDEAQEGNLAAPVEKVLVGFSMESQASPLQGWFPEAKRYGLPVQVWHDS